MKLIIQKQVHGSDVTVVTSRTDQWLSADAMVTKEPDIGLVVYGADCAMIAFWKGDKIGVCHAGWRGYTKGLIKKMAEVFAGGECYVGPFYHKFEVKKDNAYDQIIAYGGLPYMNEDAGGITFDFKKAVQHELAGLSVTMDPRCTFDTPDLASWRRDQKSGNGTQNRLVVWRSAGIVMQKVFKPGEDIEGYIGNQNTSP